MDQMPLLLPSLVVLGVAWAEWRAARAVAWAALAAAFVLLTTALRWPGLGAADVMELAPAPVAALLLAARCLGVGCFLYSVLRTVRATGALR